MALPLPGLTWASEVSSPKQLVCFLGATCSCPEGVGRMARSSEVKTRAGRELEARQPKASSVPLRAGLLGAAAMVLSADSAGLERALALLGRGACRARAELALTLSHSKQLQERVPSRARGHKRMSLKDLRRPRVHPQGKPTETVGSHRRETLVQVSARTHG